jgi:hypothetical protein
MIGLQEAADRATTTPDPYESLHMINNVLLTSAQFPNSDVSEIVGQILNHLRQIQ